MKRNAPCLTCRNLRKYLYEEEGILSCIAFDKIPEYILNGENMHTDYIEGQAYPVIYEEEPPRPEYHFVSEKAYKEHWSPCSNCKNFDNEKCPAFDVIPLEIIKARKHKEVIPGQNKSRVTFEKK